MAEFSFSAVATLLSSMPSQLKNTQLPQTRTKPQLKRARSCFCACALIGKIKIVGGVVEEDCGREESTDTCMWFTPKSETWEKLPGWKLKNCWLPNWFTKAGLVLQCVGTKKIRLSLRCLPWTTSCSLWEESFWKSLMLYLNFFVSKRWTCAQSAKSWKAFCWDVTFRRKIFVFKRLSTKIVFYSIRKIRIGRKNPARSQQAGFLSY